MSHNMRSPIQLSLFLCLAVAWYSLSVTAQESTTKHDTESNKQRTISLGIIVFPGFEPLDVFGPVELFFLTSSFYNLSLSVISTTTGPISARPPPHRISTPNTSHSDHNPPHDGYPMMDHSSMIEPTILATHTYANAPSLDILLVPGGIGTRSLGAVNRGDTSAEEFIRARYDTVEYMLSVCTGSLILARSGVLRGKKATTNKGAWREVMAEVGAGTGSGIDWVSTARWVVDGKVWTSSGVASGIDMTYAFVSHLYGRDDENLTRIMNSIEYSPHTDSHWDPYSVVHKVPGADLNASVADCVRPVGY